MAAAGGVALTFWGLDQAKSGVATMISGQPQATVGGIVLQQVFGISPAAAELLYGVAGGAAGIAGDIALARAAAGVRPGAGAVGAGAKGPGKEYVDILCPDARQHILYGDKPGSGGHMWPGQPGKTVFPQAWSADKIVHEVGDIATSPGTKWYAQTGTGGIYTYEVRDGVRMRVVYQPATGKVITAFPDNAPIPPYKPVN